MLRAIWPAVVLLGLISGGALPAEDSAYLHRFAVVWKGGGTASLNLHLPSWRVSCRLSPSAGANRITLFGNCYLKLISFLSKRIDTTLVYNSSSDSYSGTYSVDGGPPAILWGRQSGDRLTLDVAWPILVNGHNKAKIYIVNDGRGHFTLETVDPLGLYGSPMTTSDLHFTPE